MNHQEIKVTTTSGFDNAEIIEYLEPITAHVVVGMNFFKDIFGGLTDFFGGNSESYQDTLSSINEEVINELRKKAYSLGANCILGLKIDNDEVSAQGKSMMMVTAIGTPTLADFTKENLTKINEFKHLRVLEIIDNFDEDEINSESIISDLINRLKITDTDTDYKTKLNDAIKKRKAFLDDKEKNKQKIDDEKGKKVIGKLADELKEDEMVIRLKEDNQLKIIKKSQYELEKELHLTKKYIVAYKN